MSEQTITHTYTYKDPQTNKTTIKDTTYRIDADFVPKDQKDICLEFIENYCIKQGKDAIEWLINLTSEEIEIAPEKRKFTKSGKPITHRKRTALEIRKAFVEKYFKNLISNPEPKKDKGVERLNRLRNELSKLNSDNSEE